MTDDTITIEVDGKPLKARKGQMLIEITDNNDIYVPRFCYHRKLSVAANCRMCLVEVEKAPKPLPACATPVMDGMKVSTRSKLAIEAQKAVMEFLLINHPLDCPICDQGGECELQDLALGYGRDISRYQEKKRVVKDKNIGPLVQTDMTRCIHCTRCVRFGEEIAGLRELGVTGRGENMEIGTYIEKSMVSEMSGNVIDICPVGALTSKPFRFSARSWEMQQRNTIAPHDSVGSNIHAHIMRDRIMRVVPAENESINEVWISDRDRFSYEGLYHADRITTPLIREGQQWREVNWETALEFTRQGLQHVIDQHGANSTGALASPSSTLEELYLLQKFMRGTGSENIDHRIRQRDFSQQDRAPVFPWLGHSIPDLEHLDAVLLIGSNIRKEQPILNHRLRKAAMRGGRIMVINPVDYDFNFNTSANILAAPDRIAENLAAILKAILESTGAPAEKEIDRLISAVSVTAIHQVIAMNLLESGRGHILLGNMAAMLKDATTVNALVTAIARHARTTFGFLGEAANSTGGWLSGALPHRGPAGNETGSSGLNAADMLSGPCKAFVLLGLEPELDCWNGHQALHAMQSAEFVVSLSAYQSEVMRGYANVILPAALNTETAGTFINTAGQWQSFNGIVAPAGEARPAWKVLRVLGNLFNIDGFDYNNAMEVTEEIRSLCQQVKPDNNNTWQLPGNLAGPVTGLQRITDIPMNAIDPLARRSASLQQTDDTTDGHVHIHSGVADQLGLVSGDKVTIMQDEHQLVLPVVIDDRIADNCVLIQAAQACHGQLGDAFGQIMVNKV